MVYDIISSAGKHTEREDNLEGKIKMKTAWSDDNIAKWVRLELYIFNMRNLKKKTPIAYNIAMLKKYIGRL